MKQIFTLVGMKYRGSERLVADMKRGTVLTLVARRIIHMIPTPSRFITMASTSPSSRRPRRANWQR